MARLEMTSLKTVNLIVSCELRLCQTKNFSDKRIQEATTHKQESVVAAKECFMATFRIINGHPANDLPACLTRNCATTDQVKCLETLANLHLAA